MSLRDIAILTGDVKKTLGELKLDHIWVHRGVLRGFGTGGPVCILPVDSPVYSKMSRSTDYSSIHRLSLIRNSRNMKTWFGHGLCPDVGDMQVLSTTEGTKKQSTEANSRIFFGFGRRIDAISNLQ